MNRVKESDGPVYLSMPYGFVAYTEHDMHITTPYTEYLYMCYKVMQLTPERLALLKLFLGDEDQYL